MPPPTAEAEPKADSEGKEEEEAEEDGETPKAADATPGAGTGLLPSRRVTAVTEQESSMIIKARIAKARKDATALEAQISKDAERLKKAEKRERDFELEAERKRKDEAKRAKVTSKSATPAAAEEPPAWARTLMSQVAELAKKVNKEEE